MPRVGWFQTDHTTGDGKSVRRLTGKFARSVLQMPETENHDHIYCNRIEEESESSHGIQNPHTPMDTILHRHIILRYLLSRYGILQYPWISIPIAIFNTGTRVHDMYNTWGAVFNIHLEQNKCQCGHIVHVYTRVSILPGRVGLPK